jgi:hypothetical protein
MNETLFKAEQLLKHSQRAQDLRNAIAAKMLAKIEAGDISTRATDFAENNEVSELEGVMDRMRRDFVNTLTKEPKLLVQLCHAVIADRAPSLFRDPMQEAIDLVRTSSIPCKDIIAERLVEARESYFRGIGKVPVAQATPWVKREYT